MFAKNKVSETKSEDASIEAADIDILAARANLTLTLSFTRRGNRELLKRR